VKEHAAEIQNALDLLTDIIVETVPVERIYLFGSYAYGAPEKDSVEREIIRDGVKIYG
jgi:predicted nucleotidyltransferase